MIADKQALLAIISRVETGAATYTDALALRGLVQRLDEMDDLVDAVCSCRTMEIPIVRDYDRERREFPYAGYRDTYGDTEPGERP